MNGFTEVFPNDAHPELGDYKKLNSDLAEQLVNVAKCLKGKTIIHINATAKGGGVAEILTSQIPLERALGLDSRWLTINAPEEFFVVTKKIHNLLQGKEGSLSKEEKELYLEVNEQAGRLLSFLEYIEGGMVVIHDPQPLAMVSHIPKNFAPVLRVHIDLSTPNLDTATFFKPFLPHYERIILTNNDYKKAFLWIEDSKFIIIPPAIDPFTDKNKPMTSERADEILTSFGINPDKPIISQVSRFDPWKDPIGVINAYHLAKNSIPDLQLILAGIMWASDDPEANHLFKTVAEYAEGSPDIFLFAHLDQLKGISNDIFINAIQTASDIILQMSVREGFGLTVTEAMWKGKVVIAGNTIGTKMQIKNGENGFLVSSHEETAIKIIELIENPTERQKIGQAAKKSVMDNFLLSGMVLNHLEIYRSLLKS